MERLNKLTPEPEPMSEYVYWESSDTQKKLFELLNKSALIYYKQKCWIIWKGKGLHIGVINLSSNPIYYSKSSIHCVNDIFGNIVATIEQSQITMSDVDFGNLFRRFLSKQWNQITVSKVNMIRFTAQGRDNYEGNTQCEVPFRSENGVRFQDIVGDDFYQNVTDPNNLWVSGFIRRGQYVKWSFCHPEFSDLKTFISDPTFNFKPQTMFGIFMRKMLTFGIQYDYEVELVNKMISYTPYLHSRTQLNPKSQPWYPK